MTNRLLQITREFKTHLSIYSAAIRHPRTPRLARWLLVAAIAYLASPIDLIPDFIPVLGHLDDLIIVPALVALAVRLIPQDVLAELFCPATALSSPPMAQFALHHVNLIVTDLPRSLAFYQNLFGLTIIERPPFKGAGAWLACGVQQVHLTLYRPGSFRTGNVDGADCHFAFRTDDFDGALATLTANGFREDAAEDDPMRIMVRRNGPAGFPQLFLLDPDRNIIEINGAP